MISQREVERKYKKLIKDVETKDFYKIDLTNRINCYTCHQCKHVTKTKDIDAGVTPMFFQCEKCNGKATSSFFIDIAPEKKPTFEWYRLTLKEVQSMRNNPAMLEHIFNGGLHYRHIKNN